MRIRKGTLFGLVFLAALVLAVGYLNRVTVGDTLRAFTAPRLPTALPRTTPTPLARSSSTAMPTATPRPTAINLSVPFTSQAPFGVWDTDHEEFCEEAAVLMAVSYLSGDTSITDPSVAESDLQSIKSWELATFGFFEDTTAAQTARIVADKYNVTAVRLAYNPTADQLKTWLAQRRVIIVPSAGRMLGNPNFTGVGPLYHMVVLKGYTAGGQFITNDPGTRRGADYLYPEDVIMNAMHDWNGGDVNQGAKVVIIIG